MRRLTDDPGRDRMPEFAPDGRSLVFYSNRDGRWAIWRIGVDGGGLRKVVGPATGTVYINLSPRGDRVAFTDDQNNGMYIAPVDPPSDATPTTLPGTALGPGRSFAATAWSRDGLRLAGIVSTAGGRPAGVAMYDFAARSTTVLSPDQAFHVEWLADSRRIVYFAENGSELVVLDTVTRSRTPIPVRLPAPVGEEAIVISPDDRTIYYGATRSE